MAITNKLTISFTTETGTKSTLSFKYIKTSITNEQVKTLIATIIANNSIYAAPPIRANGAKLVQTDETAFDIS